MKLRISGPLAAEPDGKCQAAWAALEIVGHMSWSGRDSALQMPAFIRLDRRRALTGTLMAGHVRRMGGIGLSPHLLSAPLPVTA
jgi:hypothetical protein